MPGKPRKCRYCGTNLRWKGISWESEDGITKKCPGQVAHRPDGALRAGQAGKRSSSMPVDVVETHRAESSEGD